VPGGIGGGGGGGGGGGAGAARGQVTRAIIETLTVAFEASSRTAPLAAHLGIVIGVSAVSRWWRSGVARSSRSGPHLSLSTTCSRGFWATTRSRLGGVRHRPEPLIGGRTVSRRLGTVLSAIEPVARTMQVVSGSHNTNTTIVGTTANYPSVRST
jgi:hypothetical protein